MPEPAPAAVHRYADRGEGGFSNVTLPSGERVFLSLTPKGLRVHNLILWGRVPGKTLYTAGAGEVAQMVKVIARDIARLPKLPNDAAMNSFLVIAARAIKDPSVYRGKPLDEDENTTTPLAVLTRGALAETDAAGVVRRLQRAAATP
jgi:hypothetical protein